MSDSLPNPILYPLPIFQDNYVWMIINPAKTHCVVVDPGDGEAVHRYLVENKLSLSAILITHHHFDHVGGIEFLLKHHTVSVYGPKNESIPHCTHALSANDSIRLPDQDIIFKVLETPGHTLGHIVYYSSEAGILLSGDTLFAAGCGRLFEGTATQLHDSLSVLAKLPGNTKVCCTHEYTLSNLSFALAVEPNNQELQNRFQKVTDIRKSNQCSLPSTIELEQKTNPFLRCNQPEAIDNVKRYAEHALSSEVDVFQAMRSWKDKF